jgi:hypothetical protein
LRIELLYIEGCPNLSPARRSVELALRALDMTEEIVEVQIPDAPAAVAARFVGSPSIRIDGRDAEPAARLSELFGISCRTYREGPRLQGWPSERLLREALIEAVRG